MSLLRGASRRLTRHFRQSPELRAWKEACKEAASVPRRTTGRTRLAGYDIAYADLLTLCPQWYDLFVKQTLDVALTAATPRILDCGANVGLASLFLKSRYPSARVTAYEADAALAGMLADNLRRNNAADVEVVSAAVWTNTGAVAFHAEGTDSGAIAEVAPRVSEDALRSVQCVHLREIIAAEPIDFLKLDIEGAESAVLADCAPVLHRVGALAVEVHEFDLARRRLPEILHLLSAAGFTWSLGELVPAQSGPPAPFPRAATTWTVLVRAWRHEASVR